MAKLGEICTIVSGSTPKTSVSSYWDGDIKWITPAELNEDSFYITESVRHITEEGKEKTGLSYFPKGTVILSSRAPIGKTAIAGCEMCCNQGFKNLICSDIVYNEYLYFFLKSKTAYLNSLGRGATFKEISKTIVENIEVPLPDITKQKEIAQRLKKLEQLISLRKQQLAKLDELVKSQFVEMFGDPTNETARYTIKKLHDVCSKIQDGEHATVKRVDKGKLFISARNIKTDHIIVLEPVSYISEVDFSRIRKRFDPKTGDILLTCAGTIGNTALVPDIDSFVADRGIALLRPIEDILDSQYLLAFFMSAFAYEQMTQNTKATALAHLYLKQIKDMSIIVPPINEQRCFSRFMQQTDKSKLAIQQSLDQLELLKKSLMQQYFG